MAGSSKKYGPLSPREDVGPSMAVRAKRKSTNVAALADSGHPQVRKTHASLNVSVNGDEKIGRPRGSATLIPVRPPVPNTWGRNPTGPVTQGRTVPRSNFRDHPYPSSKKKKKKKNTKIVVESKNSQQDLDRETRLRPEDEFNRLNEEMTRRTKSRDPHPEETSLNQVEEIRQGRHLTESAIQLAPKILSTLKPDDVPETGLHSQFEEAPDVAEAATPGSFTDEMRPQYESSKPTGSNNESDDESSESDHNYEVDTSTYKVSDFSLNHTEGAFHRSAEPSISMKRSSSSIKTSQYYNETSGAVSGELALPKSVHSIVKEPVSSRSSSYGSTIETFTHSHEALKPSSTSLPVLLKSRRSSSSIGSIASDHGSWRRKMSSSSQHATVTPRETDYNQVEEVESDYEQPITPDVTYSKTVSALKLTRFEDDEENISHDRINQWLSTMNPFLRLEDQEDLRHFFFHDLVHQVARHAADICRADLLTGNLKALSLILSLINTRCSQLLPNASLHCENDLIELSHFYEALAPIWIRAFRVLLPSYKALEDSVFPVSKSPGDFVLPIFKKRPWTIDFRESVRSDLLEMVFPKSLVDYLRNPRDAGTNIDQRQPQVIQTDLSTFLLPDAINATMMLLMGRRLARFFHFVKDDEKLKILFTRSEQFAFYGTRRSSD